MIVFRIAFCGEKQILMFILLMVFWFLYVCLKLKEYDDLTNMCSKCQVVGFKSSGENLNGGDLVLESSLTSFEISTYIKQFEVIENGELVLCIDQFALKGLTEQSLIRKSVSNIFFVEISCVAGLSLQDNRSEEFVLDAQQACGVESAARANPDRPVYVLHSCPLAEDFAMRVPEYARTLLELQNVYIVALDVPELTKDWPDPLPFSSTSLGLLALWKFGGTYCDHDTLVLRSLHPLGTNYCGYRDDDLLIGDLILNFEPLGYGHTVVTQLLKALSKGSQNKKEDESVITNVVDEECSQYPETKEGCNKLTIYDSTILFAVGLRDVELFLNENFAYQFVDKIKTTAFTVNNFNRLYSFSENLNELTYAFTLAKEFCPNVYRRFNFIF